MIELCSQLIPENVTGKSTDVDHEVTLDNVQEAREAYTRAAKRLLNVNIWHKLSGFASATFTLKDEHGVEAHRLLQTGDYFQIDIPGPGSAAGDGYDWVKVEAIEDHSNSELDNECIGIRIRSCKNPNHESDETAHFFTNDATSTLIVERKLNTVTSRYHGRNEVINRDVDKSIDKIRNVLVGAGALAGISELQWSRLIKSFLNREV